MKKCTDCKIEKEKKQYYSRIYRGRSYFYSYCKSCAKIRCENTRKTPDGRAKIVEYSLKYYHKIKDTLAYKIRQKRYSKKFRKLYPEKFWARDKLHQAVKKGVIIRQPCVFCGSVKSQAHHEDYTKPLDVIWLCQLHHVRYARRLITLNRIVKGS